MRAGSAEFAMVHNNGFHLVASIGSVYEVMTPLPHAHEPGWGARINHFVQFINRCQTLAAQYPNGRPVRKY